MATKKKTVKKVTASSKSASPKKVAPAQAGAAKKTAKKPVAKKVAAPKAKTSDASVEAPAKASSKSGAKKSVAKGTSEPSAGAALEGKKAPPFELADQTGAVVSSASLRGTPYVLYFYPKDNTPGCTTEACDFRDSFARFKQTRVRVFGVSPDSSKSHAGFAQKYELPFTLLADTDKALVNAYGVWVKKLNYGREYMGVERSTFLVGADGIVKKTWRNVKVKGHVEQVLAEAKNL